METAAPGHIGGLVLMTALSFFFFNLNLFILIKG